MPRTLLPGRAAIAINRDGIQTAMKEAEITTLGDLADRIGVNRSTVHRVLGSHTAPSNEFIAGVLNAFPGSTFADLFTVAHA